MYPRLPLALLFAATLTAVPAIAQEASTADAPVKTHHHPVRHAAPRASSASSMGESRLTELPGTGDDDSAPVDSTPAYAPSYARSVAPPPMAVAPMVPVLAPPGSVTSAPLAAPAAVPGLVLAPNYNHAPPRPVTPNAPVAAVPVVPVVPVLAPPGSRAAVTPVVPVAPLVVTAPAVPVAPMVGMRRAPTTAQAARIADNRPALWVARKGRTVQEVLAEWAKMAGWELHWKSDYQYVLEASAEFRDATFQDAASAVIEAYANASPPLALSIYPENKTLVVRTPSDTDIN